MIWMQLIDLQRSFWLKQQRGSFLQPIGSLDEGFSGSFPTPKMMEQWSELAVGSLATSIIRIKSFVSEHIETLEEIDMEYKHLALESGIENWGRVPALGCTASFITDLANAVIEALPSATAMTTSDSTSEEIEQDPVSYAIKMFFGSILAFVLLLSPRMITAFRNHLL